MNKIKSLEIPAWTVLHLYQTIVQPVLVYGSDIWGVTARGLAEAAKVFNWFLRLVLRVKLSTSKIMAGEVGVFPPSVQYQKNVLMYLQRLNSMPVGSVLQSVFTESKRLSHLSYRTWYTEAKELAQSYDTDIANVGDMVLSKQTIKNNIEGHYKTSWENKMQDTENFPILRTYKLFKQNFTCENYLYL